MNSIIVLIIKLGIIILSLSIATTYVFKEKLKYGKFVNELIISGLFLLTIWTFLSLWYTEEFLEIIKNGILFSILSSLLFKEFNKNGNENRK